MMLRDLISPRKMCSWYQVKGISNPVSWAMAILHLYSLYSLSRR